MLVCVGALVLAGCNKGEQVDKEVSNEQPRLSYEEMVGDTGVEVKDNKIPEEVEDAKSPLFYIKESDIGRVSGRKLVYEEHKVPKYVGLHLKEGDILTEEGVYTFMYYLLALVGETNENYLTYLSDNRYSSDFDLDAEIDWYNKRSEELQNTVKEVNDVYKQTLLEEDITKVDRDMLDVFSKIEEYYLTYRKDVYAHIREVLNYTVEDTNTGNNESTGEGPTGNNESTGDLEDSAPLEISEESKLMIEDILKREQSN